MTFVPYDNMDDAFEDMRRNEEAANAATHPCQTAITYGDYWMRPYQEGDDFILIFGRVHTIEELLQVEDDETMPGIYERYKRGYRFGMAWSQWEPRGEFGDTHVSQMIPISKELFEIGQDRDWMLDRELYEGALVLAGLHPTQLRDYLWKGQK